MGMPHREHIQHHWQNMKVFEMAGKPPKNKAGRNNKGSRYAAASKSGDIRARVSAHPRQRTQSSEQDILPKGTVLFYGRNSVESVLQNPARMIVGLYGSEKTKGWVDSLAITARWQGDARRTYDIKSPVFQHLDAIDVPHQGVAVITKPLPDLALDDVISHVEEKSVILVLDQVTDPQNVGAALRVAAGLGVDAVITQDRNSPAESGSLSRAAAGALETVPWVKVANIKQALDAMSDAGYWSIGLAGEAKQNIHDLDPAPKTVLVVGSEGRGMRPLVREACDHLARLPMSDKIESYNASTAAAIALHAVGLKLGLFN